MKSFLAALAALAVCTPIAHAVELRIAPAEMIVLSQANSRGYNDLVIHSVAIASEPDEAIDIAGLRIELLEDDAIVEARYISAEALIFSTQRLAEAPFAEAISFQVLNRDGLAGVFGYDVTLAAGAMLAPSNALVTVAQYFATTATPDQVRVTVNYRLPHQQRSRSVSATTPVARYQSPITHASPVAGVWTQQAIPTLQSHHRLNPSTEYAVDFFRVNENGELHSGDVLDAEAYYGFGAPVVATADGVVVSVVGDETQDRASMTRRADETPQQAGRRIGAYMQERMARDFRRAAAGNLVVIRHEADGVVEYSSYGHLRTGSVRVEPGQSVRRGEVIGEVGDTGDSAAVHLHYQLNRGEDPFTSQSLPVGFINLRNAGGNSELGRVVVTR